MRSFDIPTFEPISMPLSKSNPAAWTYERLGEYIKDFEAELDSEHEIGARLVSFGQSITFHIQNVGYYGPDLISFTGIDSDGQKVQLIQHMSQLSVLLIAMKKMDDEPNRIGFIWDKAE
jgi:hypothetical protein